MKCKNCNGEMYDTEERSYGTGQKIYKCKKCRWTCLLSRTTKYFLKGDWQEEATEVTKEKFIMAERAAGFHSKFLGETATASFSGSGVRGWTKN